jgi:hypothetical protein
VAQRDGAGTVQHRGFVNGLAAGLGLVEYKPICERVECASELLIFSGNVLCLGLWVCSELSLKLK